MIRKHVGMWKQLEVGTTPKRAEFELEKVQRRAAKAEAFWKRQSRGFWDVRYEGFVMEGNESTHPPTYARNDIKRWMSANEEHLAEINFDPNYFYVLGGYANKCGQATLGGNRGVTYTNYACGSPTDYHEAGHMFGVNHAGLNAIDSGEWREYGGDDSIMSNAHREQGINSPERTRLGLASDREIINVTETQQLFLCPIELPQQSMHKNEWQHAIVNSNGTEWHFSIRKKKGAFYAPLPSEDTLYVYIKNGDPLKYSTRMAKLTPGSTYWLDSPRKIAVEYLDYDFINERARINIRFDDRKIVEELSSPDGLPEPMLGAQVTPEHQGLWHDPDFVGEGIDLISLIDGSYVVYWFTYNHEEQSRRFYFGHSRGTKEFPIYTTVNGTYEDPTTSVEEFAGTAQLFFLDSEHGVFNFNHQHKTDPLGRGTYMLERASSPPIGDITDGVFMQNDRRGEGFIVRSYPLAYDPSIKAVVCYWYTYGPKMTINNPDKVQTQRWLTGVGIVPRDEQLVPLTFYECRDNMFMEFRDESGDQPVGTGLLEFSSTDHPTLEYDVAFEGVTSVGSRFLMRAVR